MFYGNSIQEIRQFYFTSWQKFKQKQELVPLEQQIVDVILAHPEYQPFLDNPAQFKEHQYYPELGDTNPFLHMGLHLAIRDQIATDRPLGIKKIYQTLLAKKADPMQVEHLMMDRLAEQMWLAQKNKVAPDEQSYLAALSRAG